MRLGDRPRGAAAVESLAEPGEAPGEARDGVVSRDQLGEAPPPPCSMSARVEVGEAEARPKGAFLEHPDPGVLDLYVRANISLDGYMGSIPTLAGRGGSGSRSPVAKNLS